MSISKDDIQKALRIKRAVTEFFEKSTIRKVQAKELIEKDIFSNNHQDGLPIRDFLRHLYENNHLHLIAQVHYEQKEINKYWFSVKSKD